MLDADAVINNSSQKVGGSGPRKTHRIYGPAHTKSDTKSTLRSDDISRRSRGQLFLSWTEDGFVSARDAIENVALIVALWNMDLTDDADTVHMSFTATVPCVIRFSVRRINSRIPSSHYAGKLDIGFHACTATDFQICQSFCLAITLLWWMLIRKCLLAWHQTMNSCASVDDKIALTNGFKFGQSCWFNDR